MTTMQETGPSSAPLPPGFVPLEQTAEQTPPGFGPPETAAAEATAGLIGVIRPRERARGGAAAGGRPSAPDEVAAAAGRTAERARYVGVAPRRVPAPGAHSSGGAYLPVFETMPMPPPEGVTTEPDPEPGKVRRFAPGVYEGRRGTETPAEAYGRHAASGGAPDVADGRPEQPSTSTGPSAAPAAGRHRDGAPPRHLAAEPYHGRHRLEDRRPDDVPPAEWLLMSSGEQRARWLVTEVLRQRSEPEASLTDELLGQPPPADGGTVAEKPPVPERQPRRLGRLAAIGAGISYAAARVQGYFRDPEKGRERKLTAALVGVSAVAIGLAIYVATRGQAVYHPPPIGGGRTPPLPPPGGLPPPTGNTVYLAPGSGSSFWSMEQLRHPAASAQEIRRWVSNDLRLNNLTWAQARHIWGRFKVSS